MPSPFNIERALDPFMFHGVVFSKIPDEPDGQANADCIFCEKPNHFFVKPQTQLWDCKRCGKSGNLMGFLGHVHEKFLETTTNEDYKRLTRLRRNAATPQSYQKSGFAWDTERKVWLIPIMGTTGTICNLRLWTESGQVIGTKSQPIINTKGVASGLWGAEQLTMKALANRRIWTCGGEWDGVALRCLLAKNKIPDIVVAVPGENVFKKEWLQHFSGRNIVMAYDADNAGDMGMLEKGKQLKPLARSIKYLCWPLDFNDGYDVSDLIVDLQEDSWEALQKLIADKPRIHATANVAKTNLADSLRASIGKSPKPESVDGISPEAEVSETVGFNHLLKIYKKWLDISPDSVMALRIILSTVLSNQIPGDPLWFYLVAPPGSGKTALLNPLKDAVDHCIFRSNLTMHSLVSGWQNSADPSLIPQLDGKTLVLKDMTEILCAPQHVQDEIFGTLRGAYDGVVERSYGNAVHRRYESVFSIIAGVTVQIHGHHQANMGERMLKYQMSRSSREQELLISRAMQNLGKEQKLEKELSDVTNQFLNRSLDPDVLSGRIPKWAHDRILALSQLVVRLRSDVARNLRGDQVMFRPQTEIGTRLAKQLLKLAMLLTETNDDGNKFDKNEWRIVERVAFDTAIGWNLDVVQAMMTNPKGVMTKSELIAKSDLPPSNVARRLEDLLILGIIKPEKSGDKFNTTNYRVVSDIQSLWKRSMVQDDHVSLVSDVRKVRKYRLKPRS